jgi:hypothetical protein
LLEDAVDHARSRESCAVCGGDIQVGKDRTELLAFVEPEGPITLVLAHRFCDESRVIAAAAGQHPQGERASAMRWRAHLRVLRPSAMLLWDDLETDAADPGILGAIFWALGFQPPSNRLDAIKAPPVDALAATIRGDELTLNLTRPDIADSESELMNFPEITGGPWVEEATIDGRITVAYGRLRLGRTAVGSTDAAIDAGPGVVLAGEIAFWD